MTRNPDSHHAGRPSAVALPSDAYIRYLAAKRSVDDRALNRAVWQRLKAALRPATRRSPLRVIELGAGIGTMFERALEWDLAPWFHYTMVELEADYLAAFCSRGEPGSAVAPGANQGQRAAECPSTGREKGRTVETVHGDLHDVIADPRHRQRYDLIIAHAVMDLVNLEEVLTGFVSIAKPGGLFYLSLVYDGHTEFLPSWDPNFERELLDRYHRSMNLRESRGRPSGGSRAGRAMFAHLRAFGPPIIAAGSSDWIVFPQDGRYEAEEGFFLDRIIDTIDHQLRRDAAIDPDRLAGWADRRHAEVLAGELIFMARNMDFLAFRPAP
jgi:SAM-dependent methyltransferase